ncbi:MAG TPA: Mth938-like domain-containing protein [Burkholderiaceae bacterium]|nr:Mth938-like domain-containing protein [Burkholderiaceae bacterium]
MKLHLASAGPLNTVTAYGDGFIEITKVRHTQSLIVFPEGDVVPWPVEVERSLEIADFSAVLAYAPEILVLGTGARQRFPHGRVAAALAAKRIGVEAMDTQAACRTYNILVAEGRKVAAALILDPSSHS